MYEGDFYCTLYRQRPRPCEVRWTKFEKLTLQIYINLSVLYYLVLGETI